jgi:penicillin-binding protein 1B
LIQNLSEPVQAIYPNSNYLITRAMQEVINSGTAGSMNAGLKKERIAGKTGTTNENIDSWFAGFSGDRTTIAWIGRDDNKNTGLTGSTGGLKLWVNFMSKLKLEPVSQNVPNTITFANIDMNTGLLFNQNENCGGSPVNLPFIAGFEPREYGACWFDEQNTSENPPDLDYLTQ